MSKTQATHPSSDQLAAFGQGLLTDVEAAVLEPHVAGCDTCCRVLETIPDDEWITHLREFGGTPQDLDTAQLSGAEHQRVTMPPTSAVTVPPELLDHPRYRVLGPIGSGGMGTVFKAEHRLMERLVALKVINKRLIDHPGAVERFRREVKAAARLSHPNIVTAYDAEQAGEAHFLVMEYVEGTSLARVVDEHGPLPVAKACDYLRQAALGLQHAHECGMVHRDIKPQNLMVAKTHGAKAAGLVKILDFGLAHFASEIETAGALTQEGMVMGTPDYIAPEQATDAHQADIRADIYSLGCTLYHLLTGRPPFPEGTLIQKVRAHLEQAPKPVSTFRSDVPPELVQLLDRMMAKNPAERYQTPAEVAQELIVFISPSAGVPVVMSPPPPRQPQRTGKTHQDHPKRRRWSFAAVAAAVLVAAVGLAGTAVYRIATNRGELVIETKDENVEVIVKQGGEQVIIIDTKTKQKVELKAGEYELELQGGAEGLRLSTNQFTLKRGDKVTVEVRLETPVVQKQPAKPPAPVPAYQSERLAESFFRRLDKNRDGLLHVDELPAKLKAEREKWDKNRDGFIDFIEFLAFSQMPVPSTTVELLEIGRLVGHRQQVNAVAFSPDSRYILSGSDDKTARLWDMATGKQVRQLGELRDKVLTVAFAPDGRHALTAGGGGVIRMWDVTTGRELPPFTGHTGYVSSVAFSPDGRSFLSGGADMTVRIWDVESGRLRRTLGEHGAAVLSVAFSPDGRLAVSGGADKAIRVWDVETGQISQRVDQHLAPVRSVVFSPDGLTILSGADDRTVRHWDAADGSLRRTFLSQTSFIREAMTGGPGMKMKASTNTNVPARPETKPPIAESFSGSATAFLGSTSHGHGVSCVAFSPDRRYAVSGGGLPATIPGGRPGAGTDHSLRVWDIATGQLVHQFAGHQKPILAAAFSPDGRFVLSAGVDKTIRLLWVSNRDNTGKPDDSAEPPPDKGRFLLAGDSPRVLVVIRRAGQVAEVLNPRLSPKSDVKPGEYELEVQGRPEDLQLSEERLTVKAGEKATLAIRRVTLPEKRAPAAIAEVRRFIGHTTQVHCVALSPDGQQALSCSADNTIRLWEVATGKPVRTLEGQFEAARSVAFSPDGTKALSGGGGVWKDGKGQPRNDFTVRLWDVATGKEIRPFMGHTGTVWTVAFSADARYALSGSADRTLRLWEVETGRELRNLQGHDGEIWGVAFSPDTRKAVSGGDDATVRLWDLETGQQLGLFEGHTEAVRGVAFSPDGRQVLAGGDDKAVRLWDVASGKELRSFQGHQHEVRGVAFSPDGRRVLSGSVDKTVRVWDVATGQEIGRFAGHSDTVWSVTFTPDGRSALSGGLNAEIKLLKLPDPPSLPITEVHRFEGHTAQVHQVVLSPDGRQALSCGLDRTVRLWDVATGKEIRRIAEYDMGPCTVAFSPDGRLALAGGGDMLEQNKWVPGKDLSLRLHEVATGKEIRRFRGHTSTVRHVAFSPDGRYALSGSDDTTVGLNRSAEEENGRR